ncbi:MAG: SDR family oxidoreductase [Kurthia sp.]|nr:SDR family oxidoreductase [Candidatus Kurthia equi]
MKVLILGSTGMLGKELLNLFESEGHEVKGVARTDSDYNLDALKQLDELKSIIAQEQYDVVINTIAIINLKYCEENPGEAYLINAFIAGELAKLCDSLNKYFIQISTDHYYLGNELQLHSEMDKITLLNEYAKTKYLGEVLTLNYANTLVVRTNIVGFRNRGKHTFVEWVIDSLVHDKEIIGYTNMFTSSIDVVSFSKILLELVVNNETGLINLAAQGALSKYDFIHNLACEFDKAYLVSKGRLEKGVPRRGDSMGLSIEKLIKHYPHIKIPKINDVVTNIYVQYTNLKKKCGE